MRSVVEHLRRTTRRLSVIGSISIFLAGALASTFAILNVRASILTGADRTGTQVETYLSELKADLIATAVFIGNSRDAVRSLVYLGGLRPSMTYAGLFDDEGEVIAESGEPPNDRLSRPETGRRTGLDEAFLQARSSPAGDAYLEVAVPVVDFDNLAEEILYGRFSVDYLSSITESVQVGRSGYIVIVDRDGMVLAAPEDTGVDSNLPDIERYRRIHGSDRSKLVIRRGFLGRWVIGTGVVIEPDDWTIIVEYPLLRGIGLPLLITAVLVSIIAGMLLMFVSHDRFLDNRVSRPLQALERLIAEIPGSVPEPLRFPEEDEFAHLGQKYREMSEQIDELINGLENQIRDRTHELEQAQDEVIARERDTVTRRLIAGLAHEINTPLGIILTSVTHLNDLLTDRQSCTDEEVMTLMNLATSSIERISRIVARIRASTSESAIGKTGTYKWDEILSGIRTLIRSHKLKPTIHIDMAEREFRIHLSSLLSVIDRILENIIHHTDDRRPELAFSMVDEDFVAEITNSGPRIPADIEGDIFLPFSTTERPHRVGLGLFLARNTAEGILGGQLELVENVDGRITFRLRIPDVSEPEFT